MGHIGKRSGDRFFIQWVDGNGVQRQEALPRLGKDGKPLTARGIEKEGGGASPSTRGRRSGSGVDWTPPVRVGGPSVRLALRLVVGAEGQDAPLRHGAALPGEAPAADHLGDASPRGDGGPRGAPARRQGERPRRQVAQRAARLPVQHLRGGAEDRRPVGGAAQPHRGGGAAQGADSSAAPPRTRARTTRSAAWARTTCSWAA